MSFRFDHDRGLIIVRAELNGPTGVTNLRLALDTGATTTVINAAALTWVGYDVATASERVEMTTGSSVEYAVGLMALRLTALGRTLTNLRILAHTLPPSAGIDGLLGLDFLREKHLTIDFGDGSIAIA